MYWQILARLMAATLMAFVLNHSVAAAVTVTIDPKAGVSLPVNGTQKFTATVAGITNTAVTWSLAAPAGVDPGLIGTITSTGSSGGKSTLSYKAPPSPLPNYASLTVTATSAANTSVKASNTITLVNPTPLLTSLSTTTVPLGAFSLTVNGSKFVNGAQVLWNGAILPTQFVSPTQLTATGTATQLGSVSITVANPGPSAVSTALILSVFSKLSVTLLPASVSMATNGTLAFQAVVNGSANQNVTWGVKGVVGGITSNGIYTAHGTPPLGGSATVYAIAAADGVTQGTATVSIRDPLAMTFGRFLEQATYGPTPALLSHAEQIGMSAFLDEQFAMPESAWPDPSTAMTANAVDAFFGNALSGQDQLRQRVIGALSEIIVEAMNKNTNGNEIVPWLQLLSRNAFGNYRTLLREIALDASMGNYLDLVNSGVNGGAANENFPREVMQLFSLGVSLLNIDGSVQTDASGNPIPTYTQADVQGLAKALTGWTYSNANGKAPAGGNWNYYPGPMIPSPGAHNTASKTVLGQAIPANQSIQQDLDSSIDAIFYHPNIGPFVATRLIRGLVTSNPSPAYITRIAQVFNGTGANARGDMQALLRAILLDPEARNDSPPSNFGRIRPPMQNVIALCRALGINPGPAEETFAYLFYNMDEGLLDAPSVFGHYSPIYKIPNSSLFGPEFQIFSSSDAVNRANFFYDVLFYSSWPINPQLQPFVNIAGNPNDLVTAIDNVLLYGRMLPQTRSAILNALPAQYDSNGVVLTALYLTAMSGEYLVQH